MATATELIVLGIGLALVGFIVYHRSSGYPLFKIPIRSYKIGILNNSNLIQLTSLITAISGLITAIAGLIIALKPK